MRLLICEVINNAECPGVSIRDVYLCKMENVVGAARLLVSQDLKEEGRGWAPAVRCHNRRCGPAPLCKPSKPGATFPMFPRQKLGQSPWELNRSSLLAHLLWGLESTCHLFSRPQTGVLLPEMGQASISVCLFSALKAFVSPLLPASCVTLSRIECVSPLGLVSRQLDGRCKLSITTCTVLGIPQCPRGLTNCCIGPPNRKEEIQHLTGVRSRFWR